MHRATLCGKEYLEKVGKLYEKLMNSKSESERRTMTRKWRVSEQD